MPLVAQHELGERRAAVGVRAVGHWRDRIGGHDVDVGRNVDALGAVAGREHIGDVDEPGVGLALDDLRDDAADVLLEAVRGDLDARGLEHLLRVPADRHLGITRHHDEVRVGQVVNRRDAVRIPGFDDDRQRVAGERRRVGGRALGLDELVHVALVGGGEHVGRRTLVDLGHEVRRRGEVERHVHVGVFGLERVADGRERVGQRRSREHDDVALDGGQRFGGRVSGRSDGDDGSGADEQSDDTSEHGQHARSVVKD